MPFNALAIAHITKQYNAGMITGWDKLQHNICTAAYHGYDYYILNPREWCYMDKLREYGFKIIEKNYDYIVRWDNV